MLLSAPPLARAPGTGERIDAQQHAFREELETQVPAARVGWRYRLVANGFSLTLPDDDVARLGRLDGVRDVLPAGSYAPQADLPATADRRPRDLGTDARHRGPGSQDRDHRLGYRPRSSVLRPGRVHDAAGLSQGSAAIHDREGDRRSVVRSEDGRDRAKRAACVQRGRQLSWDARRGDRRRERGYRRRRPPHLGSCAARVPRQLQGLRRDGRRPEPERKLAGDRRRDRGRRRRRHGCHQLLGR